MSAKEQVVPEMEGIVVSDKMTNTIAVRVDWRKKHPLYGKYMKRSTKLLVHDPEGKATEGDKVRIQLGRPISKNKSWRLVEVLEKVIV